MSTPVDIIYNQRKDFIIVALTGIAGSGCSAFAEAMAMSFGQWVEKGLIRGVALPEITHDERNRRYSDANIRYVITSAKRTMTPKGDLR